MQSSVWIMILYMAVYYYVIKIIIIIIILLLLYDYYSNDSKLHILIYTGTVAEGAPVVPISAQLKYNIEVVCEYIVKKIPIPLRDFTSRPRLIGNIHTSDTT